MMKKATTKSTGDFGEDAACNFLCDDGYTITERNWHDSHREIDIIAENENCIVFVEVKTRSVAYVGSSYYGRPASFVDYSKRQNLLTAAQNYLRGHKINKQPRLDVIEVYLKKRAAGDDKAPDVLKINHIRNAFGA